MRISERGAQTVARRFRRAGWVFGVFVIAAVAYAGECRQSVLFGVGFWGAFQLAAQLLERAGRVTKRQSRGASTDSE